MSWLAGLWALIPLIKELVDLFIEDDGEKLDRFVRELPARLKEIRDSNRKADNAKDPSSIARHLNDRP